MMNNKRQYLEEKYDRISVVVKKGFKEQLSDYAINQKHMTLNALILTLLANETGIEDIVPEKRIK